MSKLFRLTPHELAALRQRHRLTKSKQHSYRLNALILLGTGWTYEQVATALLLDTKTLWNYIQRYQHGGIRGLLDDAYQGSEGKLTDEETRVLDDHLSEVTYRRVEDVVAYMESEFDVRYSTSGARLLLHRLDYRYKKPRKVPGQADPKAQAAFIERYHKVRESMGQDDHLVFIDGVHPQHNPLVMWGWIKKGIDKPIRTNTRFHRLNIQGGLEITQHALITQFAPRFNEESSLDFLEILRKKYPTGRLYVVLDNAGYYRTQRVQDYAQAMGMDLLYLPPYSPNLNLIERVWLYFQKSVLYNQYYSTFELFKSACERFFAHRKKHRQALQTLCTERFEILPII